MSRPGTEHTLDCLPAEIIFSILTPLSIRELVSLTRVSRRFHALINRILHVRFQAAAALGGHGIAVECYHPPSIATHPFMICSYRGTHPLRSEAGEKDSACGGLERLSALYSRYKPLDGPCYAQFRILGEKLPSRASRMNRTTLPTAILGLNPMQPNARPGQGTGNGGDNDGGGPDNQDNDFYAADTITLDAFETFCQLSVNVSLLDRGRFLTSTTMTSHTIRLWRSWLDNQAQLLTAEAGVEPQQAADISRPLLMDDPRIIWTNASREIGLKVKVRKYSIGTLGHANEEPPMKYDVGVEELFVRTGRLALLVEAWAELRARGYRTAVFMTRNGLKTATTV